MLMTLSTCSHPSVCDMWCREVHVGRFGRYWIAACLHSDVVALASPAAPPAGLVYSTTHTTPPCDQAALLPHAILVGCLDAGNAAKRRSRGHGITEMSKRSRPSFQVSCPVSRKERQIIRNLPLTTDAQGRPLVSVT